MGQNLRKSSLFLGCLSLTVPKDPQAYCLLPPAREIESQIEGGLPDLSEVISLHHWSRSLLSWDVASRWLLLSFPIPGFSTSTVSQEYSDHVDPQKEGIRCFIPLSPEKLSSSLQVYRDSLYLNHSQDKMCTPVFFIFA